MAKTLCWPTLLATWEPRLESGEQPMEQQSPNPISMGICILKQFSSFNKSWDKSLTSIISSTLLTVWRFGVHPIDALQQGWESCRRGQDAQISALWSREHPHSHHLHHQKCQQSLGYPMRCTCSPDQQWLKWDFFNDKATNLLCNKTKMPPAGSTLCFALHTPYSSSHRPTSAAHCLLLCTS